MLSHNIWLSKNKKWNKKKRKKERSNAILVLYFTILLIVNWSSRINWSFRNRNSTVLSWTRVSTVRRSRSDNSFMLSSTCGSTGMNCRSEISSVQSYDTCGRTCMSSWIVNSSMRSCTGACTSRNSRSGVWPLKRNFYISHWLCE